MTNVSHLYEMITIKQTTANCIHHYDKCILQIFKQKIKTNWFPVHMRNVSTNALLPSMVMKRHKILLEKIVKKIT